MLAILFLQSFSEVSGNPRIRARALPVIANSASHWPVLAEATIDFVMYTCTHSLAQHLGR